MNKFKIHLTPEGEGLPRYDVYCECGNKITLMWASEAEDSKTIAPVCDECGNKGRFLIHEDNNEWLAEAIE